MAPRRTGKNLIQMSLEASNRINIYRKNLPFGTYREALKFASNGGTRTVFIRFELASRDVEPKIDVDPARIDFGAVKPGEYASRRIKVTNKGQEILRWQVSVKSNANGTSPEAGRYSSFFNGDIKGSGVYAAAVSFERYYGYDGQMGREQWASRKLDAIQRHTISFLGIGDNSIFIDGK